MQILSGQTLEQYVADQIENALLIKENNPGLSEIQFEVCGIPIAEIKEMAIKDGTTFSESDRTKGVRLLIKRYISGQRFGTGDNDVIVYIFAYSVPTKVKPAEIIEAE